MFGIKQIFVLVFHFAMCWFHNEIIRKGGSETEKREFQGLQTFNFCGRRFVKRIRIKKILSQGIQI